MRIKLLEKMWRHKVPQGLVDELTRFVDEGNYEEIKVSAVRVLETAKGFFDPEEDDYVINEIDELIQSFQDLDENSGEEDFDYMLGELYDFMDGYSIFLGDGEDPVLIDEEKK
jgi:hypothetical protein